MIRLRLILPLLLLFVIGCRGDQPALPTPETGAWQISDSLYDSIVADLLTRVEASSEEIIIVRAEAAIWGDGALGCPEPGMTYTQAPVEGFWVVLRIDTEEYDYRADAAERFFLCQRPFLPDGGAPTG